MLSFFLALTLLGQNQAAKATGKPNVLVILCDDLRWDHLGCAGHPFIKTPHIDRLAKEGVRFANAFAPPRYVRPAGLPYFRAGTRTATA